MPGTWRWCEKAPGTEVGRRGAGALARVPALQVSGTANAGVYGVSKREEMIIIMAHGATAARSRTSRRVWNRWAARYYLRAESIIGVIGNGRPIDPRASSHVRCGADRAGPATVQVGQS